ncbi:MAG: HEAT repeat domain-containing protein [Deltaproteobacteria bacterium]|nr:HEAT repeat domain-containing protein [Deltaproteobacteria bacterium]
MDNDISQARERDSILARLGSVDAALRREACEAIFELADGREGFIPRLTELLQDTDAGVKEAALNALVSIGGRQVADSVAPFLRSSDAPLRNIAIEALQQLGPVILPAISGLLTDKDDDVVKFAVDILAGMGDKRAVLMLKGLLGHANPNVRASVAVCLGRIKAPESVRALIEALSDSEEWVRFSALEGIGHLQDKAALPRLLELIERETGLLREAAIDAAANIAGPSDCAGILMKLKPAVVNGRVSNVASVVELLEKALSPASSFTPSDTFRKVYFDYFCAAMRDCDRPCALESLRGLGLLKLPGGLAKVFEFINSSKEITEEEELALVDVIISIALAARTLPPILAQELKKGGKNFSIAVRAMGGMKSEEAVPILQGLMGSVAKHELRDVVSALESIGSLGSVEALAGSLRSKDGHARKIAARALASLAGEGAVTPLLEAVRVEVYRDVLEDMTDVLAHIPTDAVKKGFYGLLSESNEQLREMGARGLGLIGDAESVACLRTASADKNPGVRKCVYNALARIGLPEAADAVIAGLKDDDDEVKLSVMKALGGWSGDRINRALMEALGDTNVWVRYNAVQLLGEMRVTGAEDAVIGLLRGDEAPVKAAAAKALAAIGSKKSVAALTELLAHPDSNVKAAVTHALGILRC